MKPAVELKQQFEFANVAPQDLLASDEDCQTIENFTFAAFCKNNPHVEKAYAASSDPAEFERLFKAQIKVGLEQIRLVNESDPTNGIAIVARKCGDDRSIVGFVLGIRNKEHYQLQSPEYFGEVFSSTCGLSNSFNTAFGPVMQGFKLDKIAEHTNLFMVGLTSVHPDYMHQGIATGMSQSLGATLRDHKYDGGFSIATSDIADGLFKKVGADSKGLKTLLKTPEICFIGFALTDQGKVTLQTISDTCRQEVSLAEKIQTAGGSPTLSRPNRESEEPAREEHFENKK